MKTKTLSLKLFQPAVLAALAIAVTCGLSVSPALAGYIVTLQQVGPDVVATGSGPIDLTGLTSLGTALTGPAPGDMDPIVALIYTGAGNTFVDGYLGSFSGPTNFGSGFATVASSGSGDCVQSPLNDVLLVPQGYVSGNALSDRSTYNNATFSSLGLTPGTYEWTWGTGANQNFTLQIGPAAAPDSGSTFALFFLSLAALFGVRRFRSLRFA